MYSIINIAMENCMGLIKKAFRWPGGSLNLLSNLPICIFFHQHENKTIVSLKVSIFRYFHPPILFIYFLFNSLVNNIALSFMLW